MSINVTLIGQMITFALLVWFTMKYIWPPILNSLEERKKKIAEGLAAAERGQREMELAQKNVSKELKNAKDQSAEIISLAQKRANEIVEESKETAKVEGTRIVDAAKTQIDQEISQAKENLRKEVSVLAVNAAEQVLKSEVDANKHKDIIEKVSSQFR
ncbi:MAG: F0F1 ATP synthase subunit B [Methylococcaceae bacterium]